MPLTFAPAPIRDPIAVQQTNVITQPWIDWLAALVQAIDATPERVDSTTVQDQSASIVATPLGNALSAGTYRVSWYARITRAGTVSSTLTVTIGWTESSQALTSSGAAITGNTVTTTQSGSVLIDIDHAASLTYATTYGSVGATSMQYRLTVVVESVNV
jgi:hypothetical protein